MHKPLFALILSLCAPAVFAGTNVTVSLKQSAAYTREHNPDLAAARMRIAEAKGRLLGAGRLSNPELGIEFNTDRKGRENTVSVTFDQRFPVTARLRLEKRLSRQQVRAAELEVIEQERLIIAETQALLVKLISVGEQRTLRQHQVKLAQELSSFASDRAEKGEISPLDAAQAQVDSQRLILEARKLESERVALLGEVKPKLGISATSTLTVSDTLPVPVMPKDASWQGRPDFQLAQTREESSLTEVKLAEAAKWSDFSAGLMWDGERTEGVQSMERTGFFGVRVSLPLPFWNRNQGEIAEKNAAATRASLETKALVAGITNQVIAAREEMATNAQLANETRNKLLPLVEQQTNKLEEAYATGQTDLLTILRAREQKLQLEAATLEATRDFHLARIRYEAATAQHAQAPKPARPANSRSRK